MYPDFQYRYWLRSIFVAWEDFDFATSPALKQSLATKKSIGVGTWAALFAGVSLVTAVLYDKRGFVRFLLK